MLIIYLFNHLICLQFAMHTNIEQFHILNFVIELRKRGILVTLFSASFLKYLSRNWVKDPNQGELDETAKLCNTIKIDPLVNLYPFLSYNFALCSKSSFHYRGPRGSLDVVYFPVSIPSPSGLYAIKRMPRELHTSLSSIWASLMLSKENWTCMFKKSYDQMHAISGHTKEYMWRK